MRGSAAPRHALSMSEARVVDRVIATDAAALLEQISERHGPVLVHRSGRCDSSSPMDYPRGAVRGVEARAAYPRRR